MNRTISCRNDSQNGLLAILVAGVGIISWATAASNVDPSLIGLVLSLAGVVVLLAGPAIAGIVRELYNAVVDYMSNLVLFSIVNTLMYALLITEHQEQGTTMIVVLLGGFFAYRSRGKKKSRKRSRK